MICSDFVAALILLSLGFCLCSIDRPSIMVKILLLHCTVNNPTSRGHSR